MSKIHVYVKTPLKRNGKIVPPSDQAIELPANEAESLIAVRAVVPRDSAAPASAQPSGRGTGDPGGNDAASAGAVPGVLSVNSATAEQIAAAANGVGLKTAQDLIAWRDANGPFAVLDDLVKVGGIGKATVERNRQTLTV